MHSAAQSFNSKVYRVRSTFQNSAVAEAKSACTIVSSVIRMAHCLHLQVIAEGMETLQQPQFLKAKDCGEGQGYYFSKPVDPSECESLLQLTKQGWYGKFRSPALRAVK